MIDLDHIEQLARAATQRNWYIEEEPDEQGRTVVHIPPGEWQYIVATDRPAVLELVQRLHAAKSTAERAEKRADFYQERAAAGLAALENVESAICRTSLPISEQQPLLKLIGDAQRKHGEAGAALMERLRMAESIVRDLARREPIRHFPSVCPLGCDGERLIDPPDRSQVGVFVHGASCPWRRAREATK